MDFHLVDYTEAYYRNEARAAVPSSRAGKFVQIRSDAAEYLVLSPKGFAQYHADITEIFCRERNLSGSRNAEQKRFDIHEPGWSVLGGGRFEWDEDQEYIRFFDSSMAYGRFDPEGLKSEIASLSELSGYTVVIE